MNNSDNLLATSPFTNDDQLIIESIIARILVTPKDYIDEMAWVGLVRQRLDLPRLSQMQKDWLLNAYQNQRCVEDDTPQALKLKQVSDAIEALNLDGFLFTRADTYLGEYVPKSSERLFWMTDFSGSAGMGLIGLKSAALFVDGRYDIQAKNQVDSNLITPLSWQTPNILAFIEQNFPKPARIGIDPWLMSEASFQRMKQELAVIDCELIAVKKNPIDQVWRENRPEPLGFIRNHALEYAGKSADDKVSLLSQKLREKGADCSIICAPDAIAWLLNVRGNDVPNCPLPLSRVILNKSGRVEWYVDLDKLIYLNLAILPVNLEIYDINEFKSALKSLSTQKSDKKSKKKDKLSRKIYLDPNQVPSAIYQKLGLKKSVKIIEGDDLVLIPRATKNKVEQKGMLNAHIRDGHALIQFLIWLDDAQDKNQLPTELELTQKLYDYRKVNRNFMGTSFDTIAGSGPNGAIVHYRADEKSNRRLKKGELLLLDSGAQYQDGTTDVTRTIAIGKPSKAMIQHFTLVLKGHIAIANQVFPKGVRGTQFDLLARSALWNQGLDYAHGTGHGVGTFLNVHEGPQSISSAARNNEVSLMEGMVVSNEPGYYVTGAYGIRIENLVMVVDSPNSNNLTTVHHTKRINTILNRPALGFKQLTLVPYDRRLIDRNMLTESEIEWVNHYHNLVYKTHQSKFKDSDLEWLKLACTRL